MTAAKLPWMPFYGADFYESEKVQLMDRSEQGLYLWLLWRQWREGSLPGDLLELSRFAGVTVLSDRLLVCFPVDPDGRRRNLRLEEIRAEHVEAADQRVAKAKRARATQLARSKPAPSQPRAGQSESESESENNNNDNGARVELRWTALAAGMDDTGKSALEGFRRGSQDPGRLLDELEALVSGLHGPGGRPVSPKQLGTALHDMALASVPMTALRLRAFARKAMEPEPPPKNGQKPEGDLSEWVARKEAEQRAKREGTHAT